ncbi:MAG: UDP-N-acetylmuramoyl-L-alanine--D-glutamate ligase [Candidatus Omnitrophica bacterium]|nr:UDP-N-acetylmuramoyl-L-alanine--D-glutamate ligase [Candidatus Omnitrophota bacterium]
MVNENYFKKKKITVVGLGKSGLAAAGLLHTLNAEVWVSEKDDNPYIREAARQLPADIRLELGRHSQDFIKGRDLIVTSPGVEKSALPLAWAEEEGIRVISEIEVASILCPAQIIAITGTNGKTTVTTLIGGVLKEAEKNVFVAGNIGQPFCASVDNIKEGDFVSLEVSSFQLERISCFKPRISVILNFSCDHLDRYSNMDQYLEAKARIFINQDKDNWLVLNEGDSAVRQLARRAKCRIAYFNEKLNPNLNLAAVIAVSKILEIKPQIYFRVFAKFRGLPHRLEKVAEFKRRLFINDSKATNVDSAIFALKSIDRPVILIAGGKDKGADFEKISQLIRRKVKALILIGEAAAKMRSVFDGTLSLETRTSLKEALQLAFRKSSPGDCILFSPMCSSFDMFRNYEERGNEFIRCVRQELIS